jgi:hypothetical protein
MNLFTIVDLYIMVTNPFKNADARVTRWLILALIVGALFAVFSLWTDVQNTSEDIDFDLLFHSLTIFNFGLSLAVLMFVFLRLGRGGISMETKKEIQTRYTEFVIVFILFMLPISVVTEPSYTWVQPLGPGTPGYYEGGTEYAQGLWVPVCGLGIALAASRLRDPLIFKKCSEIYLYITCRRHKIKSDWQNSTEISSLNAVLQSTLNTEIIISILKGIMILAASSSDNADNIADSDMLQVE